MEIKEIVKSIKLGNLFVYPTDTLYGLGCNAENKESVERIKEIKGRDKDKPLSVIAPSIDWIENNLLLNVDIDKFLPGPYTLILEKKNPNFLPYVAPGKTLGVRIPKHTFTNLISQAKVPFITTSVNLSGENPILRIADLPTEIKNKVDIIIPAADEKSLSGKPSRLVIDGKVVERK